MKQFIFASILLLSTTSFAQISDTSDNRTELAKEVVRLSHPEAGYQTLINNMNKNPITAKALAGYTLDDIALVAERVMAKHFTTRELQAMVNYYSSPEGISIVGKTKDFQKGMAAEIQEEMRLLLQEALGKHGKPKQPYFQ